MNIIIINNKKLLIQWLSWSSLPCFCSAVYFLKGRTKSVPDGSALLFHGAVFMFFVLLTLPMYTSFLILLAIVSAGLLGTEQGISLSCTCITFPLWEHTVSLGARKIVVYMLFTGMHWFAFPYIACHLPSSWGIDLVEVPCTPLVSAVLFAILTSCLTAEVLKFFSSTPLVTGFHTEAWGILFLNFCSGEGWLFNPVVAFHLLS